MSHVLAVAIISSVRYKQQHQQNIYRPIKFLICKSIHCSHYLTAFTADQSQFGIHAVCDGITRLKPKPNPSVSPQDDVTVPVPRPRPSVHHVDRAVNGSHSLRHNATRAPIAVRLARPPAGPY